ncbi:MAG TPA: LptF/LptG family permease [Paracoccaceae bacterium]|nr:LptF/LptG family permease [Paracoccaceae bacterium]
MTLGLYLTRVLGLRILAFALGLLALALGLDLLRESRALAMLGGQEAMARYALLRLPALAPSVLPLAVLFGAASGFLALSARTELTVIRGAGVSAFGLLRRLIPLALALGALHALVTDRGVAWSERALAAAFGPAVDAPAPEAGDRIAVRLPGEVAVARLVSPDGTALRDVTIFALDEQGGLAGRLEAERAMHDGEGWRLEGVRRGGAETRETTVPWTTSLTPAAAADLAAGARAVTAAEALRALGGRAAATRGADYLAVQVQRVGAAAAAPAVMLTFAALGGFGAPRSTEGLRLAGLGGALGLAFLALDGMAASLGRIGSLPPVLAAWAPTAAAAAGGIWALLLAEERT